MTRFRRLRAPGTVRAHSREPLSRCNPPQNVEYGRRDGAPLASMRCGCANLVVHVVGARPNYMKVAPVYAALERRGGVEQRLVHTGQHYDRDGERRLLRRAAPADAARSARRRLGHRTASRRPARSTGLEQVFIDWRPDLVVVPGDVNSTLAAALAAVKLRIPVCHLEAGLRSFDWGMPEEHNRRLTDHVSSLLLTHSEEAQREPRGRGDRRRRVELVGNTMIDTLLANVERARALEAWRGPRPASSGSTCSSRCIARRSSTTPSCSGGRRRRSTRSRARCPCCSPCIRGRARASRSSAAQPKRRHARALRSPTASSSPSRPALRPSSPTPAASRRRRRRSASRASRCATTPSGR